MNKFTAKNTHLENTPEEKKQPAKTLASSQETNTKQTKEKSEENLGTKESQGIKEGSVVGVIIADLLVGLGGGL